MMELFQKMFVGKSEGKAAVPPPLSDAAGEDVGDFKSLMGASLKGDGEQGGEGDVERSNAIRAEEMSEEATLFSQTADLLKSRAGRGASKKAEVQREGLGEESSKEWLGGLEVELERPAEQGVAGVYLNTEGAPQGSEQLGAQQLGAALRAHHQRALQGNEMKGQGGEAVNGTAAKGATSSDNSVPRGPNVPSAEMPAQPPFSNGNGPAGELGQSVSTDAKLNVSTQEKRVEVKQGDAKPVIDAKTERMASFVESQESLKGAEGKRMGSVDAGPLGGEGNEVRSVRSEPQAGGLESLSPEQVGAQLEALPRMAPVRGFAKRTEGPELVVVQAPERAESSESRPLGGAQVVEARAALEPEPKSIPLEALAGRFDKHMLSMVEKGEKVMKLTVEPPSLGKLTVTCREENGMMQVSIQTQSVAVRQLLMQQETPIRELLQENGSHLDQFDVSCDEHGKQRHAASETNEAFISDGTQPALDEEEDAAPVQRTPHSQGSVSLVA